MSNTFTLILRPRGSASREDALRDVASIMGGELSPEPTDGVDEYGLRIEGSPRMWIDLDAGYDDEGDPDPVPYGEFPWQFNVDDPSDPYWHDIAMRNLRKLFDGIAATGRYDAIVSEIGADSVLASNVDGYPPTVPNWYQD